MPTTYNAITGLKRKAARRDLSRKKRATQSSTVASRRYAEQAMEQFHCYIFGCQLQLVSLGIICNTPQLQGNQQARAFAVMLFLGASIYYLSAIHCLVLDSRLLDLHDHDEANSGFSKELQDITLESFDNDDECEAKTRFTKEAITSIIGALNQPDVVRLYYAQPSQRYYKFKVETLVIYMLRKMSTARRHALIVIFVIMSLEGAVPDGLLATSGSSNSLTQGSPVSLVLQLWGFGHHSFLPLQRRFGSTFKETKREPMEMGTKSSEECHCNTLVLASSMSSVLPIALSMRFAALDLVLPTTTMELGGGRVGISSSELSTMAITGAWKHVSRFLPFAYLTE
jgi:hypothetical protein